MHYPEVFTLLNGELEPRCQEIEIASSLQIPHFQIIGLPGPEVSEAKDRVRSAIESSGLEFPRRKIVMNLSPASVRKEGTGLDLAMAVAVIIESWKIEEKPRPLAMKRIFAWGELGVDGKIKSVRSPIRAIEAARRGNADLILISRADEEKFKLAASTFFSDKELPPMISLERLSEVTGALQGECPIRVREEKILERSKEKQRELLPISPALLKVLQIAAAGAHHFLLLGPKGVGKSLALEWFLALQPPLDPETVRSRSFLSEISGREGEPPFRRVSTQVKPAALLGSFSKGSLRAGEFSLAHGGVLLADEFPEWSRDSREALREPLERRKITLTRVDGSLELPADFIFAGNGNLCPCGGVPDSPSDSRFPACRCLPSARARYFEKLSGPILDRIDLVSLILNSAPEGNILKNPSALASETGAARSRLISLYGAPPGKLSPEALEKRLSNSSRLRNALDSTRYQSFRDRHKTLRLALTLAALQGKEEPDRETLFEARSYRLSSLHLEA